MSLGRSLVIVLLLSLLVPLSVPPASAQELSPILVYTGNDGSIVGYSDFGQAAGRTVEERATLPEDLSSYGCIVLPRNVTAFSSTQLEQFASYVQGGGWLFALGENRLFYEANDNFNAVAAQLGSGLSIVTISGDGGYRDTTNIEPTPFTEGVRTIRYASTSHVTVTGNGQVLARTEGSEGVPFIGAELIGAGLFVVSGDTNAFSDNNEGTYGVADNGQLVYNLCSAPLPEPVLVYTGNNPHNPGFSRFGRAAGRAVEEHETLPADLSGYDCLILPRNATDFSQEQLDQFVAYVEAGGRLFALGEWDGQSDNQDANENMTTLASALGSGLAIVNGRTEGSLTETTNIEPSVLTTDVSLIKYVNTSSLTVTGEGQVLVRTRGQDGVPFIGAEKIEAGLFVLVGDTSIFMDDEPNPFTGSDNDQLAFNLCSGPLNEPPSVTVIGVTGGASYEYGSVPIATCAVTDPEAGPSSFPATLSAITGPQAALGLGSQTASCSYTSSGGTSVNASAIYSIVDTTAPTLTMPGDMTEEATSANGASVTFLPTASDTVDPNPTIDCDYDSGDTFPLGETTVTCTATDASGNISAEQTFTITVEDTTAPALNMPEDQTEEATSDAGASVTFSVTADDIVDPSPSIDCDHDSGDTFAIGQTTVTCTATDAANNTSAPQSFTITVGDTTAPVLGPLPDLVVPATGPSGTIVTWVATAEDAVEGTLAADCTPPSGSFFAIPNPLSDSITTVECSVMDSSGNTSNDSFTVTVLGADSQFDQLQAEVQGASIHRNAKTTLDRALASAEQGLERNRLSQSCVQLSYFQTQVNLYRAMGQISSEQANDWIADAARLKAVLGC